MNKGSSKFGFREKLKNKFFVFKENNPSAFIFIMIIFINVLFIMFSSFLLMLLPENNGRKFSEIVRFAFTLMINPSGRYQYSDYPISLIITTVVVLLGMISLTGGTVGYITNIINQLLEKSANNKSKVKLSNHIVILNYNHKVPSLIYDYCFDDIDSTYIVILSMKDKDEVEVQIDNVFSSNYRKNKFKNIIIRKGNPMSKLDLDSISLKTAKTVLIMNPEEDINEINASDNQNFAVSKLFMFITWYFSANRNDSKTNIVVETSNVNLSNMVKEYHLKQTNQISVPVNYNEILGKIMAMTAIMPSLNDVLLHMISFEGAEIYMKDASDLGSISDELRTQQTAIPLFDIQGKRAYIAENEDEIYRLKSKKDEYDISADEKFIPCIELEKSEIIIIGVNSKLPYILDSFVCFVHEYPDIYIHIVLMDTKENKDVLDEYYSDERYACILAPDKNKPVIINDIFDPLKNIDIDLLKKTNSILFLSDEKCDVSHIDEKPLLFWSKLKDIEINARDCIVEILDMQNKDIIERQNQDQVIVSDKFLSCIYAQIGKDPMRLDVIRDIITFKNDTFSKDINNMLINQCNIFAVRSRIFFKNYKGSLKFKSKRELIIKIYESTDHLYMPVGCIKDGVNYLFARTDNSYDDLDSAVLFPKDEGHPLVSDDNMITLGPDDEIIVLRF